MGEVRPKSLLQLRRKLKRKKIRKKRLEQTMMIMKRPKRRITMNLRMVQADLEGPEVHQVKIHLKNLLDQVKKLKSLLQPAAMRPRRNLEAKKTRKNSTRDTTKVIISTRAAIITR